jgi:hypothetical protein
MQKNWGLGLRFKGKRIKVCPFCITDLKYNSVTGLQPSYILYHLLLKKKLKCLALKPNSGYGETPLDYIERYYTFAFIGEAKVQSYPFANGKTVLSGSWGCIKVK